ncbi:MAG: L,D-transpeptidase [Gaiellaceae bacterium]
MGRLLICSALCTVTVHATPGGPVVARYDGRTDFGSPLVLAVGARRGRWIGVFTPAVPNGRLGWVRAGNVEVARVETHVVVSLSRRRLTLYRGRHAMRSFTVGIGAPGTATPTGEFAITDKLPGARFSPVYGCCILALSGHQTHLPRGWTGGNRLAIHGGAFGAVSTGCLHADTTALRFLMAHVPLGTRVTIRA